jgi:hypothetical protein
MPLFKVTGNVGGELFHRFVDEETAVDQVLDLGDGNILGDDKFDGGEAVGIVKQALAAALVFSAGFEDVGFPVAMGAFHFWGSRMHS